jgi:hypothetical protein
MRVFLDDIRFPADCRLYLNEKAYLDPQWIIVRDFEEFVSLVDNTTYYCYDPINVHASRFSRIAQCQT